MGAWGSDSGSSQSQSGWQAVWVSVMWDRALEIEFLGLLVYMSAPNGSMESWNKVRENGTETEVEKGSE